MLKYQYPIAFYGQIISHGMAILPFVYLFDYCVWAELMVVQTGCSLPVIALAAPWLNDSALPPGRWTLFCPLDFGLDFVLWDILEACG